MQEPSVLIRVPGKTRDQLNALRRKVNDYSWSTRRESIGQVVARLAEAASSVRTEKVVNKASSRRRKAMRR